MTTEKQEVRSPAKPVRPNIVCPLTSETLARRLIFDSANRAFWGEPFEMTIIYLVLAWFFGFTTGLALSNLP